MGLTNFVSRPFAGLATILCEYTENPLNYVIVFAMTGIIAVRHIVEYNDDSFQVFLKRKDDSTLS
jgi:hypothetical protein